MRLEHLLSGAIPKKRFQVKSLCRNSGLFVKKGNERKEEKDEAEPQGEVELVL